MPSVPPLPRNIIMNGDPTPEFLRWLSQFRDGYNIDAGKKTPVGAIMATIGGENVGTEWLLLNGQSVNKADYPALYAMLTGSVAETATTFALPDMRNRTVMGAGAIPLLTTAGNSAVTLSISQLPAHDHPVTDAGHAHSFTGTPHTHTITDPGHTHTAAAVGAAVTATGTLTGAVAGNTGSAVTGITVNAATAGGTVGNATTGVTVGNRGGGLPVDITPPALGVNWLVKT